MHSAATNPRVNHTTVGNEANFDIVYEAHDPNDDSTVTLQPDGQCYYILQKSFDEDNGEQNITFSQFSNAHRNWASRQANPVLGEETSVPAFLSQQPRGRRNRTIAQDPEDVVQDRTLAEDPEAAPQPPPVENNFAIYECYVNENGTISQSMVAQCVDPADCFTALHNRGHKVQEVDIYNGSHEALRPNLTNKTSQKHLPLVYFELFNDTGTALISKKLSKFQVQAQPGTKFYAIKNLDQPVSFNQFCGQRQNFCSTHAIKWSRIATLRKIFHPGNFLLLALACVAAGLILTAFFPPIGLVAAPFLAFFAVGFAAAAAISGIGYAIHWLKREYDAYKTEEAANGRQASFFSLNFLKHCFSELKTWAKDHPVQAGLMIAGAVLLLAALVVTVGYFIAPAVFGFMALGAAGGAIGLTTSFFSAGFGIAASGGLLATLAATFAGAALITGPTHLLDTIRRVVSWFFKKDPTSQIEHQENPQRPRREDYNDLDNHDGQPRRIIAQDPEQPLQDRRVLARDPEEEPGNSAYGHPVFHQPTAQEIEAFKTRTAVNLTQEQQQARNAYQNNGDTLSDNLNLGGDDDLNNWLDEQPPVVDNADNYDDLNPFSTGNNPF